MSFDQLGLSAEILRAVSEKGYTEPTPIQKQAIPVILEGRDVLGGAQTGTGKTAGFTLPLLQHLSQNKDSQQTATNRKGRNKRPVRALVLTPTRELAAQVGDSVSDYGKFLPLNCAQIYGGVSIRPQIATLRNGVDILVATPGRLLDHVGQRTVDLSQVQVLVLDEADRMLDMGFIRDIRKLLKLLPKERQNLLFSATFSKEIKELADTMLDSPVMIEVAAQNTACDLVTQVVYPVDRERKRELLSHLIGSQNWRQVLVFTRTKHGADRLTKQLESDGLSTVAFHGNKSQAARARALADFKKGKIRVLAATDVASRGLDIDLLPHVVNFDLPSIPEDYVHRIGRTGRAGSEGEAISLVCVDEHKLLRDIEQMLKKQIPRDTIEGYEPDPSIKAQAIFKNSNRGAGRSSGNSRGGSSRSGSSRSGSSRSGSSRSGSSRGGSSRSGNSQAGNSQSGNRRKVPNGPSHSRGGPSRSVSGNTQGNTSGNVSGNTSGNTSGNENRRPGRRPTRIRSNQR